MCKHVPRIKKNLREYHVTSTISSMKIEKAYSTDIGDVMDVETAYDLFWGGRISDKHNFECAFPDCVGSITAANLDRLRQNMSVDPYYKKVGEHTAACKTDTDTKSIPSPPDEDAHGRPRGRKSNELADVFGLSRPPSHAVSIVAVAPTNGAADPFGEKKRKKRAAATGEPRASTHYSLLSFVSKFQRYRCLGVDGIKFINIKGYNVPYVDMFVPIKDQSLSALSDYPRIYFGRAYIDEKPHGYRIGFTSALSLDGCLLRPSTYISKEMVKNSFSRKMSEAKFDELSKRKRPDVWVFIYSKPTTKKKNDKTYINFPLDNLDYFDFRDAFDLTCMHLPPN